MKYLNLGCGKHFSLAKEWINVDFSSAGEGVIAHNLLNGIPFESNTFDVVYHSHVLEHFSKTDGEKFIKECIRVLKPGGIIRIAIPNLEQIARNYIQFVEEGLEKKEDELIRANYEWTLIEMYDQTVRNMSGGAMGNYLFQDVLPNEDFVFNRIGEEGRSLRDGFLKSKKTNATIATQTQQISLMLKIKLKIREYLLRKLNIDMNIYKMAQFRLGGEIHQWMYDRYSLSHLLESQGAINPLAMNAFTSNITNWSSYNIDGTDGIVRKPDSLFIEAVKK